MFDDVPERAYMVKNLFRFDIDTTPDSVQKIMYLTRGKG
jgi:hypothetical protein